MGSERDEINLDNPDLAYLPAVVAEFERVAAHFYNTIELMRAVLHLPPLTPLEDPGEDDIPF